MVRPDLVATDCWPKVPTTETRTIASIPIIHQDIGGAAALCRFLVDRPTMVFARSLEFAIDDMAHGRVLAIETTSPGFCAPAIALATADASA
eukprot:CAMPEP_0169174520 /NCGR_PEP_ID=MMETSP1015-20121227/64600_1 /TAXON_ID=342587 /ORGANISM="Karlodinium micrum, Strain CCMP2283" /LENGTH=91 /DNA_ID=CAMNT_0009248405 /DNA_START=45 /DNA_END=317 /DNA_ORIENTATION=+